MKKFRKDKIKLLIFDAGDIIYDTDVFMKKLFQELEKFFERFNVKLEDELKLWKKLYPRVMVGKLTLKEANEIVFKKIGIPKSKVREWLKINKELCLKYFKPKKDSRKSLEKLKKNFRIAFLSDTAHPMTWVNEFFKKSLKLERGKHYDKIFTSNRIGFKKPHKKAYEIVLKYFKVKPDETIFIGHDEDELIGATKIGMITISLNGSKKVNYFVKNWKELYRLLKS